MGAHEGNYCFAYSTDPLQYQDIISSRFKIPSGIKSFSFWFHADYASNTPLQFFYTTKFHGGSKDSIILPISKEWTKYSVNLIIPLDTTFSSNDSLYMLFFVNNPSNFYGGGIFFYLDDVTFDSTLSSVKAFFFSAQKLIDINPNPISAHVNLTYHCCDMSHSRIHLRHHWS